MSVENLKGYINNWLVDPDMAFEMGLINGTKKELLLRNWKSEGGIPIRDLTNNPAYDFNTQVQFLEMAINDYKCHQFDCIKLNPDESLSEIGKMLEMKKMPTSNMRMRLHEMDMFEQKQLVN